MASIISIVYQPEDQAYGETRTDYIRTPLQNAKLVAGHGILGDRKAGHNPERQLNVLSQEWLEAVGTKGYRNGPGQFGEQIIVSDLPVEKLTPGTQLQLGESARIEVVKTRTGCERLEAAQRKSIQGLGPIGVMAKVVTDGVIEVGDSVTILKTETSSTKG